MSEYVRIASAYADAMLRQREKTIVCDTKKPVAWIAFATDGSESSAVYLMQEQAQAAADEWGWSIAPLYATPQPLTEDEREAVSLAGSRLSADPMYANVCGVLFGLLKRTK